MKSIKLLAFLFISTLIFTGCSDDDDDNNLPDEVNEEEVITTMTITLTPAGGGTAVTLQTRDADGDGPNAPVLSVSGDLAANTTYTGSIELLNETVSPADIITEEIEEEDEEHQFFFVATGVNATFAYTDSDENGNPVGLDFTLTTTDASTGSLTFTLKHEPSKPNNGTATDAGGETDIETTFNVTVQ
ncbi:type 1 periplasmic binding fold superfamily protein [Tenacibaculum jejuense]|uniref:Probable lipoprotein n=1 Tax=Tenacibaculum jejuense TaxID=584609 RepID=A0A238UA87_9FLAO|nr:type 1 periplasmic binding fold superfamily protein [Tenacibaculum jejuense]SNR16107.1 Probable lipoprotein precursor [Tenacibaculum jejuense]